MRVPPLAWILGLAFAADAAEVKLAATAALSPDGQTLVFEWREDLWTVPSTGGVARALTRHPAVDRFPVFSPDGTQLAFMSLRDGTYQVHVMPAAGGPPRQVTFHSEGASPQDWHPDGRTLLVRGTRENGDLLPQRFLTVDTSRRAAESMLFDDAGDWGRISPDGTKLLYTRLGEDLYRRGYRGSKAAQIWTFDLKTGAFACVAKDAESECRWPLWKPDGKAMYFVREGKERGTFNLFEKALPDGREKQLTFFQDFSVMFPAVSRDGSVIVLRNGFDFHRFAPGVDKEPRRIAIVTADDEAPAEPSQRITYMAATAVDFPGTVDFTADGKQIVFAGGGNLWAMDTVVREPVPITTGQGVMDNWAWFGPGDQAVYFLRDTGDSANVHKVTRADGNLPWWRNQKFKMEPVTQDDRARSRLQLAPRGGRMAWVERPGSLWVAKLDGTEPRRLLASPVDLDYDWSPDGKWLVAAVQDSDDNRDIWICAADASREPYNLSRHPNWDGQPKWSPDGRVIAYAGKTYDNDMDLYYVWLREADHGRLVKETDWLKAGGEDKKEKDKPAGASNAPPAAVEVQIDFDGLCDRIQRVNINWSSPDNLAWSADSKALSFQGLVDGKAGTWKIFFPHPGKPETVSAQRGNWPRWTDKAFLWAIDGVPAVLDAKYPFTIHFERDLVAWRRLGFLRMWRQLRDEFYDPKLNNRDWNAIRARYEPLLPQVDEAGFARLVEMMMGELNASHLGYVPPKRTRSVDGVWPVVTGHLGVRFDPAFAGPGLRVADVIPDAPADREITRIKSGDIILAIDGAAVAPGYDLTQLLNGPLPRFADLELQRGAEQLRFRLPLTSPDDMRKLIHEADVKKARARVAGWSSGRAGYIDIAHMKTEDLRAFEKEVYAQGFGRDGLVIDVRDNTGGFVADQILSILCHPNHAVTVPRGGEPSYQGGYIGHPFWMKPVVVLCNEYTVSNGEIFSHAIKATKRGRLVGAPTQAGVISTGERTILDLGTFRNPHRGWFVRPDGLDMERHGAVPDIVVPETPATRSAGEDPQLKAAVEALLKDCDAHRRDLPKVRFASEEKG